MDVKPGYKQTEVGVIPEEWEAIDLSRLCTLQRGFDITEATKIPGTVPVYSSSGLSYFHNKAMANPPGVVTGRKGILGKVFVISEPFWPHDTTLWVKDFRGNSPAYVALILENFHLERLDAATSVPTLNRNNLAGHLVPIPPSKAEQEVIAEALSDADALIESLEHLLAKKRHLKQGTMQELLTGKKRLRGFRGDWDVVNAGEIGRFRGGSGFPSKVQGSKSGDFPFFKVSDMNIEGNGTFMRVANNYISNGLRQQLGVPAFPSNSIVFAKVGAAVFLERKKILAMASCLDNNMAAFVLDASRADFRFIHYLLLNTKLSDLVSTTALPSLNGSVLAAIKFKLPTVTEQSAIVAILSDTDPEIAALESRLAKARNIKQGMMQELLTGRIRLV